MLSNPFDFNNLKLVGFVGVCALSLVGVAHSDSGTEIARTVTQKFSHLFATPNSRGAIAVGAAEGTMTPDGKRTWAYFGHVDPGNGARNLGMFSDQHGASSPAEADAKQLARLRSQGTILLQQARAKKLQLDEFAFTAGVDLANQAPRAALDRGGYVDRLKECRNQGKTGTSAVLCARTNAFRNPDTRQWDAPGLGNNENSIRHDQKRRLDAISAALLRR